MGVHSTVEITRGAAKRALIEQQKALIARIEADEVGDEELKTHMDAMLHDRYYNCSIVPDDSADAQDSVVEGLFDE